MLVVLGLSCTRAQPPTVGPCLSQPYDPSAGDVGPCLSPPVDPTGDDTTGGTDTGDEPPIGPCLSPPAPGPEGPDAPTPSPTPQTAAATRDDALERVLARATLPADVAERLRRR